MALELFNLTKFFIIDFFDKIEPIEKTGSIEKIFILLGNR